jgi:hypothetical protein
MNQEHEQQPQLDEGARIARDLAEMVNAAESPEAGIRLAALYNEYGAAVIAFMQLPDTNIDDPDVRQNFVNVYVRTTSDRNEFLTSELDDLDWRPEVNRLIRRLGIPDDVLVWNERAVWGALHEMYDIVDYGGQTHVFWV